MSPEANGSREHWTIKEMILDIHRRLDEQDARERLMVERLSTKPGRAEVVAWITGTGTLMLIFGYANGMFS